MFTNVSKHLCNFRAKLGKHAGNFQAKHAGNFRAILWQLLTDLLLARSTFNERFGTVRVGSPSNEIYF